MHYVFFFPDELRAKSLACYNNPVVKTPNFDRLAKEGVLFENNYTTHPVCMASRCSLMTGWYPHVQGFRTLRYELQSHHPNFMQYIHDAGYQVHLYGKNHVFSKEVYEKCIDYSTPPEFGHGAGSGRQSSSAELKKMLEVKDYTMLADALPDDQLEEINDTQCVNRAVEAIRNWKEGDKPLFIYLPTFYPHAPYTITEEYHNMYDPDEVPPILPRDLEGKPEFMQLIRHYRELGDKDEAIFRKIHAVYLGMCSYSDMLLGRLLDALDDTGLADSTTVIASSDHGDWAGDYGLVEKWPSAFDDDIAKVPLIIRSPVCKAGHRVQELTQTFDIFPTICDLEDIEIKHDHFAHSLIEQLKGAAGDPNRKVYCEGGYDQREPHCFEGTPKFAVFMQEGTLYYPKMIQQQRNPESVCRGIMARDSHFKLVVRTSGDNELYDMISDPNELRNLYGMEKYRNTINILKSDMLTWLIHTSDVVPWAEHI